MASSQGNDSSVSVTEGLCSPQSWCALPSLRQARTPLRLLTGASLDAGTGAWAQESEGSHKSPAAKVTENTGQGEEKSEQTHVVSVYGKGAGMGGKLGYSVVSQSSENLTAPLEGVGGLWAGAGGVLW